MQLKEQQLQALEAFNSFLADDSKSVFILKGYAGTGKTTLLKAFLPGIIKAGKVFQVMAPTGRAAKVLREKTQCEAFTIHRSIYSFDKLLSIRHDDEGKVINTVNTPAVGDDSDDDLQFMYGINYKECENELGKRVYVVDEASMINSRKSTHPYIMFGTGFLMNDLLTFAQLHKGNKIVFVGDPAQLPPVGDSRSVAFDEQFFENLGYGVMSVELTQVLRQGSGSAILSNAMKVRNLLNGNERNTLVFDRVQGEVEDIDAMNVVDMYTDLEPQPCIGGSIVVCYTNMGVHEYNRQIRETYFPRQRDIVAGDVLQVVKNNMNVSNCNVQVFNGDFVTVVKVSPTVEEHNSPVWVHKDGKSERVLVSLKYRDVVLRLDEGEEVSCKIVESLLTSPRPEINKQEHTAMFIDFMMRHSDIRNDKDALSKALKADPYYNAVFVKYGYAVTAHKSQGGEWDNVIVDYTGRTGLDNDTLRWNYTATTRAAKRLWGVNMPSIQAIDRLVVTPAITRVGKPFKNQLEALTDLGRVDALPDGASVSQRCKYLSIKASLPAGYSIDSVTACNYMDRYVFTTPHGKLTCDCFYNAQHLYTTYRSPKAIPPELDKALHSTECYCFKSSYTPKAEGRRQFHTLLLSLCDSLGITVTGVSEEPFKTTYGLATSGAFAYIDVWFNGKGAATRAMASSDLGQDDALLVELLNKLNNNQ